VKARDEGLARVNAFLGAVESDTAEVASYQLLTTTGPDYKPFL
jgi:hypothetical protein